MNFFNKIWSSKYFYPALIISIGLVLAGTNFTPSSFLSGWDTLHPEFNFQLAFSRIFTGVWRTDQGLGTVAVQSHIADLPRIILLWLESLILPLGLLRYATFFVALIIGPLGIYFLTNYLLKNKHLIGFLAALTYLTNLGTVQHFTVPLEMFAVHFALLPWLFFSMLKFLLTGSRKIFLLFCLLTLLSTPQAHTATLFYAYFLGLVVFAMGLVIQKLTSIKKISLIIGATLTINAFWLLPNIYSVINNAEAVRDSKVNRLFSPEAFAKNQEFGNIKDTAIFKNFLFDWQLFNFKSKQFEPVLKPWIDHLNNPLTASFGYLVFAISAIGIVRLIIKKDKFGLALLPVFLLSFLIILNGTWPINDFFKLLSDKFPVASEALRFPFTKFSILLMVSMSIYFGIGLDGIMSRLNNLKIKSTAALLLFAGSVWYFWPAFGGNLINPAMRIKIPNDYFQMFNWFNKQNHDGRVAILPINSFWNWTYYNWGYQGAGFLQFGIPQPILDRDYDRWNPANEQYQREMAYAIYSQNPAVISQVLTKFNIRYILFDKSVIAPGETSGSTVSWLIPDLLKKTENVALTKKFGSNISVYEVNNNIYKNVVIKKYLPDVIKNSNGFPFDQNFAELGDYISKPFNPLVATSNFDRLEHYLGPVGKTLGTMNINELTEIVPCGKVDSANRQTSTYVARYTTLNGMLCDHFAFPNLNHSKTYAMTLETKNISGFPLEICLSNNLTRHCDLFIRLDEQKDFKTETYLLPPLSDYGSGYTVNLNNYAVNGQTSINEIKNLTISEAPYETNPKNNILNSTILLTPTVSHPNPAYYKITLNNIAAQPAAKTLILNQSYDKGWLAWNGTNLLTHLLVNNWANGWIVSNTSKTGNSGNTSKNGASNHELLTMNNEPLTIYIFFWPQLLEWLGFLILPIPIIFALYKKSASKGDALRS